MPWFIFQTAQGPRQLFADSTAQASTIFFQKTGITALPSQVVQGDSPAPGVQFISGGGSGDTAGPKTFAPETGELNRAGAFRRGLARRGLDLGTLAGGSILGQEQSFEDAFSALQALGRTPGGEQAFETFAASGQSPFSQGLSAFKEIGGMAGRSDLTDQLRAILNIPTDRAPTSGELFGTARLGEAALRGQVGAFGSNPFFQNIGTQLPEQFAAQSQQQQAAMPFFQFLRRRLGI